MNVHLVIKNLPAGRMEIEGAYIDRGEALELTAKSPLLTLRTLPVHGGPLADGSDRWRIWRMMMPEQRWAIVAAGLEKSMRLVFDAIDAEQSLWYLTAPGQAPPGYEAS